MSLDDSLLGQDLDVVDKKEEKVKVDKKENINFQSDNSWRLLITKTDSYKEQMAIDEANMEAIASGDSPPIVRVCYFKKPSVSIGFFQSVFKEVDVALCAKEGVEIFRRMTGGGAVYKDPQREINYSFIIPERDERVSLNVVESYKIICDAIIKGLNEEFGINAVFKPINDIVVNNKKISGNAQTRREGVILQHGTILLDVDYDKMFSLLKIPDEKIKGKMINSAKERVTSLSRELGRTVSFEDAERAIIRGFEDKFNVKLILDKLSRKEIERARFLYKYKYDTEEWNFWK